MQVLAADKVVADGDREVTLPPTCEPNTPKKGAFSFLSWNAMSLMAPASSGISPMKVLMPFTTSRLLARVRFGRCGFLLLHRIQFFLEA